MRERLTGRKSMRALLAVSAASLLTLVAACGGASGGADDAGQASDEVITIDFATYLGENTPQSTTMKWWADELNTRSDGRLEVQPHYAESLLKGTEMLQGVADGRAEIGWIGNFYFPGELPLSSVTELPFGPRTGAAMAQAIFELYEENEAFRAEYRNNNVHIAYVPAQGVNTIGTKDAAVGSLEDLEGLSLRAGGRTAEALDAVGVNPVALAAPEIYESVERGVVDGYSTMTLEVIPAFGLEEVTGFFTEAGTGPYVLGVMGMNLDFYQSLDEDLKQIVDDVSAEAQTRAVDDLVAAQDEACQVLQEADVEVSTLDEATIEEWKSKSPDFEAQWIESMTAEGLPAQQFFDEYRTKIAELEDSGELAADGVARCAQG